MRQFGCDMSAGNAWVCIPARDNCDACLQIETAPTGALCARCRLDSRGLCLGPPRRGSGLQVVIDPAPEPCHRLEEQMARIDAVLAAQRLRGRGDGSALAGRARRTMAALGQRLRRCGRSREVIGQRGRSAEPRSRMQPARPTRPAQGACCRPDCSHRGRMGQANA